MSNNGSNLIIVGNPQDRHPVVPEHAETEADTRNLAQEHARADAEVLPAPALQAIPQFPRITPERIEHVIRAAAYHVFPGTTVTVCCLTLENGFSVVGTSACACPENFDTEVGRYEAFKDAERKIWELEGYLLKQWLHLEQTGQLEEAQV